MKLQRLPEAASKATSGDDMLNLAGRIDYLLDNAEPNREVSHE